MAILSVSKDALTNLAEMADKIMSVYNPTDISSINKQDQFRTISCSCEDISRLSSIEASIESLSQPIHKLHWPNYNKSRSHSKSSLEILPTDCADIIIVLEPMLKNAYKPM
ncbi:hypothetical protein TNCT_164651 [Trichonephila clavata]|uniref:Uncharacterized protein n=1 Tax=Trichonephila clavata TaxID=2740835 RepID=A0A8X6G6Q1_TRICU|nr:hypothetical protein TNCT_164651 [Trichonephila clavata]